MGNIGIEHMICVCVCERERESNSSCDRNK
jgi:hypothetical protein